MLEILKIQTAYFLDHINEHRPDIVAITETWLTARDTSVRAELKPHGYKLPDQPRCSSRKGGGTGLLILDVFTFKHNISGHHSSFESTDWTISIGNQRIRIIVIYRPPYSVSHPTTTSTFIEEFSSFLENTILCREPLIITGDFNIHNDMPSESILFTELFILSEPIADELFSDHFTLSCSLTLIKCELSSRNSTLPGRPRRFRTLS